MKLRFGRLIHTARKSYALSPHTTYSWHGDDVGAFVFGLTGSAVYQLTFLSKDVASADGGFSADFSGSLVDLLDRAEGLVL